MIYHSQFLFNEVTDFLLIKMITINKDKDKDYYNKDKDDKDENKVVKELTDSPMPQDLLHAPHGPQPVTWQFRGSGNTKIRDKFVSENIFSLSYSFSSFSSWSAAASSCVSRATCSTSSVSRRRPRSGCTELTCFPPATRRDVHIVQIAHILSFSAGPDSHLNWKYSTLGLV